VEGAEASDPDPENPSSYDWGWEYQASCIVRETTTASCNQSCTTGQALPEPGLISRAGGVVGCVRHVDEDSQPVALAHGVATERAEPAVRRPCETGGRIAKVVVLKVAEAEVARAEFVEPCEPCEIGADRPAIFDAEENRDATGFRDEAEIGRVARERERGGICVDERMHPREDPLRERVCVVVSLGRERALVREDREEDPRDPAVVKARDVDLAQRAVGMFAFGEVEARSVENQRHVCVRIDRACDRVDSRRLVPQVHMRGCDHASGTRQVRAIRTEEDREKAFFIGVPVATAGLFRDLFEASLQCVLSMDSKARGRLRPGADSRQFPVV
jgi:hypothetical protein